MKRGISVFAAAGLFLVAAIQSFAASKSDSLCFHLKVYDEAGLLRSWYQPNVDGAAFSHVTRLATGFLRDKCPREPKTDKPLYYLFCEFPHPSTSKEFYKGTAARHTLPHNPACVFAGLTQSLAVDYRVFYGDDSVLELVRGCLDHMIENGTTPTDWPWAGCPYASSDPGKTVYAGGSQWQESGRGDGLHVIEPDKVGEMGVAYLQFYEITGESRYLNAALACADALAKNIREGDAQNSPWPYRVNAETGKIREAYCSNILSPVMLFDELLRIKDFMDLPGTRFTEYQKARDAAWKWLFSKSGPMKTACWKSYFEDTPIDSLNANRVQITPLEVARYIIQHPEYDPYYKQNVPALINWCESVFGTNGTLGYNAQCEQLICYQPMGSHTARYASVCALWYELSGDGYYKAEALQNFNWATYCCDIDGIVSVGPRWLGAWFSDGYGDYIKHFFDGMAAVPEWAPAGENHLLRSTSVVQSIHYSDGKIRYRTFLPASRQVLKLTRKPHRISVDGIVLSQVNNKEQPGWYWTPCGQDGVLYINHSTGREIQISF